MAEYSQLLKEIKAKKFHPVYFLEGDEPFFIDHIADTLEQNALDESQKGFNQYVLYGKDTDMNTLISRARQFPMMGDRMVIIVREAQEMASFKRQDGTQQLVQYLENQQQSTILVFCYKYKTIDKRGTLGKLLSSKAALMTTKPLYDNQVPAWIQDYAMQMGLKFTPKAQMLMAEHVGNNLQRIVNEIDKISINVKPGEPIEEHHIHTYVGISKDYNVFELQKALAVGTYAKAHQIAMYFAANPTEHALIPLLSNLYGFFSKLLLIQEKGNGNPQDVAKLIGVNPFFVKEYMDAVRRYQTKGKLVHNLICIHEADLKIKGINFNGGSDKEQQILTDLIYQLMH